MQRKVKRSSRGEYMSAGVIYDNESELYIAREMPGSSRENLRDNAYANRYTESPEPVLGSTAAVKGQRRVQAGPLDILVRELKKDRLAAFMCGILLIVFLGLGMLYISKVMQIQKDLKAIEVYRANESFFAEKNIELEQKLELAKSGERIRNQALNSLGMLRREKADIREIYIQLPEDAGENEQNTQVETKFELLDALLNLIGIF